MEHSANSSQVNPATKAKDNILQEPKWSEANIDSSDKTNYTYLN